LKQYYHFVGWTYLNKQYKDKLKRDGAGTRIPTKYRHDQRHTGLYEIGGKVGETTSIRLRQECYFNDSNDVFQDFYDAQDYKVRINGNHDWTPHWSSSGAFTYELKRYEARIVSQTNAAQRDNAKTYEIGLTYRFTPQVDLTYSWKYKRNTSNDDAQAYGDLTNSLALTGAF